MTRRGSERRLATVLFVDVVDSTRVAAEVGDRRWRELLRQFRRRVRAQLRAHGGHEQDTAGDGFFATFSRPAAAVRAASAIVHASQALGIDVRCGVHTGELERIESRFGGIGVHIGARVMAQAGPAEVLVTSTVNDLVVGSGIGFGAAGDAELRGVPGRWALYRVTDIDGVALPAALGPHAVNMRLDGGRPQPAVPAVALVVAVLAVSLAAVMGAFALLQRAGPSAGGIPTFAAAGSPGPTAPHSGPPTMLRIDPATNQITHQVHDKYLPIDTDGRVLIADGTLWQATPINLVRRDLETGEKLDVIDIPAPGIAFGTWVAFGSVWFWVESTERLQRTALHRLDPLSGRTLAVIEIEPQVHGVAFGRDAIYALSREADLLEIDPDANAVVDTDSLPIDTIPDGVVSVAGAVWVCECEQGRITHWDPQTDAVIRTVEFAQRGFVLPDSRELTQGNLAQGNVSGDAQTVWLMDGGAGTLTPINAETGAAGQPIGIPQGSYWHDFGLGSIWISAYTEVYRLRLDTLQGETIDLPDDVYAGGIAADEATGAVWLANFVPFGE